MLQTLCDELLALSGYDRALAYKFDEEYNGSVVAETLTPSLSGSYFNHHFPASDIPSQARDLLLKKRVRCIPNTRYAPVFIHSDKTATDELDLTDSDLRSVSPVHLAYCQNMGLEATLTVVLILRGALWGLIGLQGSSPKQISHAMFDFCQDVSLIASNKLEGITLLEERNTYSTVLSREREFEALRKVVGGKMRKAADMDTILSYICHELDCDAVVARVGHTRYSFGIDEQGADQILDSVRFKDREIWCTDNLTFTIPPNSSDHLSAFRGGINFCDDLTNSAIVGLRREHVYQRIWAGSRDEKVSRDPTTNMLTPRASFSAWEETVRGRSLPWSQVQKTMMPTMKALVRRVHQEIENLDLSLLARSTTNGVVFTDRKGFLTWANEAFVKISGYPLSKLMGRKPGNLLQGEKSSPETVKHMADCIKAHSSFEVDVINYHQDGSEYLVHISCQPIDKEDPQSGFIAIETDITERIRAREEMTRLVDRLQAAADATNIGIWEYDLVSGTLIWDEWMHRIFGTDPGTFSNTYDDWANTLHPDDKERADGQVKKAIEECTGFDSKFRIHRNGNEVRHIAGKAKFVFSKDGAPIAMIGTNADITEEVLRTEQLEAAKKA
ncbi:MAG: PAS domain-containing protein, partial [Pseudomonadales bacterium]